MNSNLISKALNNYADQLKIKDNIYDRIRSKRNIIINLIILYVKEKTNLTIIDKFNLGSYKIKTGVQYYDNDYDIDYGIVLKYDDYIDEIPNLKEKLCVFLRSELKYNWKSLDIIVKNKNKVIAIRFRNNEKSNLFHLDIPIYIYKNHRYNLLVRKNNSYFLKEFEPKKTFQRQNMILDESKGENNKRNAIILLKHLRSRNHIRGVSSIYITDKIISFNHNTTYRLLERFFKEAKLENTFKLKEKDYSNLILNSKELNGSSTIFYDCFFGDTWEDVFNKLNKKFNYKL